jgi:hypothetical protein
MAVRVRVPPQGGVLSWENFGSRVANVINEHDNALSVRALRAQSTGNLFALSDTALDNHAELFLPVEANAIYDLSSWIIYQADAAGDLKVSFTGPAGATLDWVGNAVASNQTALGTINLAMNAIGDAGSVIFGGNGNGSSVVGQPSGTLYTSSTPGNFQFRFAQGTSSVSATFVMLRSWIKLTKRV